MLRRTVKPGQRAPGYRAFRILSYLVIVLFCAVSLFPIFYAIMGSFKSNMDFLTGRGGLVPDTFHLINYEKAWTTANFARYSINSVLVTLSAIVGGLTVTSMAAYTFSRGNFPGRNVIMKVFLASMFLATGAITIFPIFSLAKTLGLSTSLWGLVIVYIFTVDISCVYLITGYMNGLPRELDEAAKIDGCGFFQTYLRVLLPLCKPILATAALLIFKMAWNDYLKPMVFTLSNDEMKTLTVGVVSLKNAAGSGAGAYDMMLAGTVIALVPMLLFYSFTSKFFISGITAGAVKG